MTNTNSKAYENEDVTRDTLVRLAIGATRAGRRVPLNWEKRMAIRDRVGHALRPHMAGVWAWLTEPSVGEYERAYARRAAHYAAARAGISPDADAALVSSVASVLGVPVDLVTRAARELEAAQ